MKTFSCKIKNVSHTKVIIGRDMDNVADENDSLQSADKICFAMEANSPKILKDRVSKLFAVKKETFVYELPHSENAKTFSEAQKFCSFLYAKGFSRKSLIIGAGGGTVTDLCGFVASVYMRGIKWISVPTTFLGQIDAGIGGKTALNLDEGKNIVGSFWQPETTVCDTAFLDSLPHAELRTGAGELVKYSLIMPKSAGAKIIKYLPQALIGDKAALNSCVTNCAAYKLKLIGSDERDEKGKREPLNLGHTAGHAFEAITEGQMHHGEAVARGIIFSTILSHNLGKIKTDDKIKVLSLIDTLHLPDFDYCKINFGKFLSYVERDKKNRGAKNRFIILRGMGKTEIAENVSEKILLKTFEEMKK